MSGAGRVTLVFDSAANGPVLKRVVRLPDTYDAFAAKVRLVHALL